MASVWFSGLRVRGVSRFVIVTHLGSSVFEYVTKAFLHTKLGDGLCCSEFKCVQCSGFQRSRFNAGFAFEPKVSFLFGSSSVEVSRSTLKGAAVYVLSPQSSVLSTVLACISECSDGWRSRACEAISITEACWVEDYSPSVVVFGFAP